jgi:hypothetical protein
MAKLSDDQIAQILQLSGGNVELLTDADVSTGQIIRALVNNPSVLGSLQKRAKKEVTGYGRFYKDKVYDPAFEFNDTEAKYRNMRGGIAKFASEFWGEVKRQGSDLTTFSMIRDTYDNNKDVVLGKFNMTSDEYDDVMASMDADLDAFQRTEVQRQKKQMAAYTDRRKKLGITSRETAAGDYLATKTGITGLADVPTSVDAFAASKVSGFTNYAKKQGLKDAEITALVPQLETAIKKKVGKNYKNYALSDLLKRQVTGE